MKEISKSGESGCISKKSNYIRKLTIKRMNRANKKTSAQVYEKAL